MMSNLFPRECVVFRTNFFAVTPGFDARIKIQLEVCAKTQNSPQFNVQLRVLPGARGAGAACPKLVAWTTAQPAPIEAICAHEHGAPRCTHVGSRVGPRIKSDRSSES